MAKVSYSNLKLKINNEVNTFEFNGQTIEVKKYLNISDKYDLIMVTLQKAEENGIYNPLKLDIFFHLHLVYMYTNVSFTERQKENELKLYDCLISNGFIDQFLSTMEKDEYDYLFKLMDDTVHTIMKYRNSAGGIIRNLVNDLPKSAEAAAKIVDSFDPTKYKQVIEFAAAANGGRPINQQSQPQPQIEQDVRPVK